VFANNANIKNKQEMEVQIKDILADRNEEAKSSTHATLFHEILQGNLPPEELAVNRLQNEAMGMIGAGVETTKWALSVGCFHILTNPGIEERLRAELEAAIINPDEMIPWSELEKLPYLTAVIQESMYRHAFPTSLGPCQVLSPKQAPVGSVLLHKGIAPFEGKASANCPMLKQPSVWPTVLSSACHG
jgi:cytochrome P450